MKTLLHKAEDRGLGEHGWLKTHYSFSFASWYEPSRMGFGALRVLNDDIIAPANGFGRHGHKDMEIITIVTQGEVTHTDSMGNAGVVKAGEVQTMSAGTGVAHAESNDSPDTPLTLFQIWIEPKELGIAPRYAQKAFNFTSAHGFTKLVGEGALQINQDASISYASLTAGESLTYKIEHTGNGVYVFIINGQLEIGGRTLGPRDALGVTDTDAVELQSTAGAHLLLIEVPI